MGDSAPIEPVELDSGVAQTQGNTKLNQQIPLIQIEIGIDVNGK